MLRIFSGTVHICIFLLHTDSKNQKNTSSKVQEGGLQKFYIDGMWNIEEFVDVINVEKLTFTINGYQIISSKVKKLFLQFFSLRIIKILKSNNSP